MFKKKKSCQFVSEYCRGYLKQNAAVHCSIQRIHARKGSFKEHLQNVYRIIF